MLCAQTPYEGFFARGVFSLVAGVVVDVVGVDIAVFSPIYRGTLKCFVWIIFTVLIICTKSNLLCFCLSCCWTAGTQCEGLLGFFLWASNQVIESALRIPFPSAQHAIIARDAIDVDAELQPHAVKRVLTVEDNVLVALVSGRALSRIIAHARRLDHSRRRRSA